MQNIHVRGADENLMKQLKHEAVSQNISINTLILNLLQRGLGLSKERNIPIYHDLDPYAGTWNKQQAKSFLKEISDFESIDKELWK